MAGVIEFEKAAPETKAGAPHSPATWFANRFPPLREKFGDAILEEVNKAGIVVAKDVCEPFLAATLGAEAMPDTPTVFISAEDRFYTYLPAEGVYVEQRPAALHSRLSCLLLEVARGCPGCDTKSLEFRFRDSGSLTGIVNQDRKSVV